MCIFNRYKYKRKKDTIIKMNNQDNLSFFVPLSILKNMDNLKKVYLDTREYQLGFVD